MEKIRIFDGSGDHKYFSQAPNIILDTCGDTELALYMHIKRIAGDFGECEAGERYFMEKLKCGYKKLKKALTFLVDSGFIKYQGKRAVGTVGGVQQVNIYTVCDVWEKNIFYYNPRCSQKQPPLGQGVARSSQRCLQKEAQGVAKSTNKEELIQEEKEGNKNLESKNEIQKIESLAKIRRELEAKGALTPKVRV